MIDICDKSLCVGCAACKSSCPKDAIVMAQDADGFLYPSIDQQKCVDCLACKRTCPVNANVTIPIKKPLSFAAQCSDIKVRESSSSGGVFFALAMHIISSGGVVYGAAFDELFNVSHIRCETVEDLYLLQGSKYVQSDTQNIFKSVENDLKEGKLVLFTGTPCQVAAIASFLKKDYPNFYSQDIICHGVPSPLVWQKYIEYHEKKAGGRVTRACLRNKQSGWKFSSVTFTFSNGSTYAKENIHDPFMRIFVENLSIRKSCSKCSFKGLNRKADITLADFWGIHEIAPEFDDDKGTSLVLIHSLKGRELFNSIKFQLKFKETEYETSIRKNPSMISSITEPALRKSFFTDLVRIDFDKLFMKYCSDSLFAKIKRKIASIKSKNT